LIREQDTPFAVHAVERVEHYMELMDVDEEDLGLIVAPWYKTHEDIHDGERLPEEEYHWEMHVNARDVSALRDPDADADYRFNAVVPFDYEELGDKEFLETEYTTWIRVFEDEFSDAEIYSPELPEDL
jgi:hypothetical protein